MLQMGAPHHTHTHTKKKKPDRSLVPPSPPPTSRNPQTRVKRSSEQFSVTVADYSVLLKGVPPQASEASMLDWARQWGEALAAVRLPAVGDALRAAGRMERLEVRCVDGQQ